MFGAKPILGAAKPGGLPVCFEGVMTDSGASPPSAWECFFARATDARGETGFLRFDGFCVNTLLSLSPGDSFSSSGFFAFPVKVGLSLYLTSKPPFLSDVAGSRPTRMILIRYRTLQMKVTC